MDNTNSATPEKSKGVRKVLVFIFLGILVIADGLVSYYLLYARPRVAKNNTVGVSQGTPPPNTGIQNAPNPGDLSLIHKTTPTVYDATLPPAKVGEPYKAEIQAGVDGLNVQIYGREGPGLPPGIKLTSCKTEYANSAPARPTNKVSSVTCAIEGTPEKSGTFTVRIYFAIQDGSAEAFKDTPLIVNP
jgi:hypothetical protein